MSERNNHPVWDVYDLYRTARLNVKYYQARLHKTEQLNFAMEFILLFTAPSSAIAGLWFWDTVSGQIAWKYLGLIAAFIAILKPLLFLTKKIKSYEEVLSGYKGLEHDLQEIKIMITQKQKYDKELQNDFSKALKRKGVLVNKIIESKEDKKLKSKCEKEVISELPKGSFFIPQN